MENLKKREMKKFTGQDPQHNEDIEERDSEFKCTDRIYPF